MSMLWSHLTMPDYDPVAEMRRIAYEQQLPVD